jgi:hypothetical protein
MGSWFPTVDTVARFAIDDYSWGIVRTKDDSIQLGTTFEISTTVYLDGGGSNIDGAFFGFGDQWMYYGGNFYGVWFGRYGAMNNQWRISFVENSQSLLMDSIGTYSAGDTITFTLSLTQDGKLHAVSSKFNQYYTPTSTFTNRRFIIANANCTNGHGFEISSINRNKDLVAYYPFNGNANDESGNGNSGTTNGGVTWDTDRFNNSSATAKFNGVNTDITVNYNPTLFPVEQTISVWVKFNDLTTTPGTNPKILCTADQIDWRGYQLYLLYGGYVRYQDYTPSGYNAVLDFPVNQIDTSKWYHFVILRYTTEAKMYVNGNLVDSITNLVAPNLCQSIGLGIGADIINNREHLNGKIDDIRIYNIALTETEIQRLYENYRQRIRSVTDIPNDQGGKVRITWDKIYLDTTGANPRITQYAVWRKIPLGATLKFKVPSAMALKNDTLGVLYDFLGSVNAVQSIQYNFVATTLADSPNTETFLITAHTSDPNVYYLSDAVSGYSVDNIPPLAVTSLSASIVSGSSVQLNWNPNISDTDLQKYEVYRSTHPDFIPDPASKINDATTNAYLDASVTPGYCYYYKVLGVDYQGNHSTSSPQVSSGIQTTQSYQVKEKWNMISVPLEVSDWSRVGLFPNAVSHAYSYSNGYVISDPLNPGSGYWLKFNGTEIIPLTGYFVDVDTFDVKAGWNMIGSISFEVPINSIMSIPSEMTVSNFFGYQPSGYVVTSSIIPGSAYWVRASQVGKLVLSSSTIAKDKNNVVRIVATNELPPTPPDGSHITLNEIPKEYSLNQNYPNPFNPSTTIKYGLPEQAHVILTVHNTLGQQVANLVDEQQKEGYHEVVFTNPNLPSGVYFYRLQAGNYTDTKKLLLIK